MTNRRSLLKMLAAGVLARPVAGLAQRPEKLRRVGVLSLSVGDQVRESWQVFEEALRNRGWTPGRNLAIEYRFAEGKSEQLPSLAKDLVQFNIDVIVAGLGTTSAAHKASARIPIVMIFGLDATETGLVENLGRPGGNITGLTGDVTAEVMGKRLELLRELAPSARRVAVLHHAIPGNEVWWKELRAAARNLGFTLHFVPVQEPGELERALDTIRQSRPDALFCGGDPVTYPLRGRIAEFALQMRLPGVYGLSGWADAGGLVSYGVNLEGLYRRAAGYVDSILRGAKPAELAVERPVKYDLAVNQSTARALGIKVPQSILVRADRVIE